MTKADISVLITRPKAQAQSWVDAVQAKGWQATSFPTLEIQPLPVTAEQKQYVLDLDLYQGVICISSNAADIGLALLADYWPQWPMGQIWYAVGPATAEAMNQWQIRPRVPPAHDSEGLLGLASLKNIQGQRFLILKGQGGRDAIRKCLTARGARVDELPLYRRVAPKASVAPLQQWLASAKAPYIAISSGDGLKNLMAMAPDLLESLKKVPLVVVSERLGKFAYEQGFKQVIVAQGASDSALIEAITQNQA